MQQCWCLLEVMPMVEQMVASRASDDVDDDAQPKAEAHANGRSHNPPGVGCWVLGPQSGLGVGCWAWPEAWVLGVGCWCWVLGVGTSVVPAPPGTMKTQLFTKSAIVGSAQRVASIQIYKNSALIGRRRPGRVRVRLRMLVRVSLRMLIVSRPTSIHLHSLALTSIHSILPKMATRLFTRKKRGTGRP